MLSNQLSCSRSRTTSPTTSSAGEPMRAASSAIVASVAVTVSWSAVVPQRISAAGVSAGRPMGDQLRGDLGEPPDSHQEHQRVDPLRQRLPAQAALGAAGSSWPVINATDEARLRCVTGYPRRPARPPPMSPRHNLPGHTSRHQRLRLLAAAPKHNGSPPFRRTTWRPARAWRSAAR